MLTSLEAFSSEEHIYVYIPPTNFNKAKEAAESALKKAGFENYTIIEAEPNYIGGFILENERQTRKAECLQLFVWSLSVSSTINGKLSKH